MSCIMRKLTFCMYIYIYMRKQSVFATSIVQFLFFTSLKFPASSHLLCLYSSICVGPVWKPHCCGSKNTITVCKTLIQYNYVGQTDILKAFIQCMSCDARKPVFRVSDQAQHRLACTVTETG